MVQIDMSMPQSCEECPFGYVNYVTNVDGCDLMDSLPNSPDCSACTPMGQRDKNCPLREAPEIIHCRECRFGEVDNPCLPDQYFCHHNGCDWNLGDHYCGYAERRENK